MGRKYLLNHIGKKNCIPVTTAVTAAVCIACNAALKLLPSTAHALVIGFAPLMITLFLCGILTVLFFKLLCSVEVKLSADHNTTHPQSDTKVRRYNSEPRTMCAGPFGLYLKEHSPPSILLAGR
jgi:hypothetical protein